jgi:enoyl-CoA hydratase/carnithine racemase
MTDAPVLLQRSVDGVAVVRLNRPDKRNALDSRTLAMLNGVLDELVADENLRVLVVSTTSTRALCAGADIGEALDDHAGFARMAAFTRMYSAIDAIPVPVIAVCVGNCVGAGAEIVAGADLRVGGDNLTLAWAGARLGVPVGPARLGPLIGVSRAKDLIYTGRVVGMDEARELGLLHRTAPARGAEAAAIELAVELAVHPTDGLRRLKALFRELDGMPARVALENDGLVAWQRTGAGLPYRGR